MAWPWLPPLPACLAGSKVLSVERVAHFVSFSRPIAASGGDRAGMFCACENELIAKLVHRARHARWGLSELKEGNPEGC